MVELSHSQCLYRLRHRPNRCSRSREASNKRHYHSGAAGLRPNFGHSGSADDRLKADMIVISLQGRGLRARQWKLNGVIFDTGKF